MMQKMEIIKGISGFKAIIIHGIADNGQLIENITCFVEDNTVALELELEPDYNKGVLYE